MIPESHRQNVIAFPPAPDVPVRLTCSLCREALDLSQPDVQVPEHLLGICEGCQRWHLVQMGSCGHEAMMVALPEWATSMSAVGIPAVVPGHVTTEVLPHSF